MADVESSETTSPYLDTLSGDAAERITAMKWARYLGAAFGPSGALSALRYYTRIDWISEEVRRTMVDYVRGLTIEELELSEVEPELHGSLQNLDDTEFERHARSLQFVAAISGRSIEHGLASLQLAESINPGVAGHPGVGSGVGGMGGHPPSMGATGGPFVGGAVDPGEQAEMAAGESQRQRDRARRDERARETPPPGGATTASADADTTTAEDPDADPSTDVEDIEVSQADVTPGTVGTVPEEVETNGHADEVMPEETPTDDGEAVDDASDDWDLADDVDDLASDVEISESDGEDSDLDGVSSDEDGDPEEDGDDPVDGASTDGDDADETDPDALSDAEDAIEDSPPDPEPEPSPSASSAVDDGLDATFGDGEEDATAEDGADADENRCIALTRDGDRCARRATSGGDYCHQHAPGE